jgi:hypothetical protein
MTFPRLPHEGRPRPEAAPTPTAQELWLGPRQPRARRNPWLWIGLAVGGGAVALAVAAAAVLALVVFSPGAGVKRASEQMSSDLAAGRLADAYRQFTPALKGHLSETELTSRLTELKIDSSCSADISRAESLGRSGQRPRGEAEGVLVCGTRAFDLAYRWEGDPLLLDGIRIQPR